MESSREQTSPEDNQVHEMDEFPMENKTGLQRPDTPDSMPSSDEDTRNTNVSFCSMQNMKVAFVQACGAALNGYSIGFVGVQSTLYGMSTNCADYYAGETACTTAANTDCLWLPNASDPGNFFCGWPEITCRYAYPNSNAGGNDTEALSQCEADPRCNWSYGAGECQNPYGYTPSDNGIFAGSMIVGCMFGSFFAGRLVTTIGSKLSFLLVGIVSVACSVMYHVSIAENEFWVLIVARFIIGMTIGICCVACPMYVDQNAHPKYKNIIGVMFQVFITFGCLIAAVVGLAVGQSVNLDHDKDQMLMARMQAMCCVSTLFSALMIFLGIIVEDTHPAVARRTSKVEEEDTPLDTERFTLVQMLPRLLIAAVMAGTLQLTGINAVMNYAPTIMGNLGLAPLLGNFIVMAWNFVCTSVSIPLASVFTMRQLFLFGSIFASVVCLFLCGIPVYPGVTKSTTAKNGVAITGILLFIAGSGACLGPCFFVLAQDLFPRTFRPTGASFTQVMQFIFNAVINIFYPIATQRISGGPSGNQDKGQAIAFMFFGGIGLVCFVVEVFRLYPYESDKNNKKADKYADRGADIDAVGNRLSD